MEKEQKGQTTFKSHLVAGALTGGLTRFIVAPFDVVKIRFQVQGAQVIAQQTSAAILSQIKPVIGAYHYKGLANAVATILKNEGIKGFWRGNLIAEGYWICGLGVQFTVFEFAKATIQKEVLKGAPLTPTWSFVAGAAAGLSVIMTCYPLDLLRTRFAAQSEPKVYPTIVSGVNAIWAREGWRGFYSGVCPAVVKYIPYIGIQFSAYNSIKTHFFQSSNNTVHHLLGGAVAGMLGKFLVLPIDIVQKRLQVHGLNVHRNGLVTDGTCPRMWPTFKNILFKEGFFAFFAGGAPSVLKTSISAALTFALYERIKLWLSRKEYHYY